MALEYFSREPVYPLFCSAQDNSNVQIGIQVGYQIQVRLLNLNLVTFPESSLLPVADQLNRRPWIQDWCEM